MNCINFTVLRNSYGHPHEEVLERLKEREIEILRTDEMGSVVIESDRENIVVMKASAY